MDTSRFKPSLVYTIYIAATPERVWQALTSADDSREYFSGFAVEVESEAGGAFVLRAPDGSRPRGAAKSDQASPSLMRPIRGRDGSTAARVVAAARLPFAAKRR